LLTRHPAKGVCPERPTGVKDLSCESMRMSILPAPNLSGSERSELRILHPGWLYGTKDLSSHRTRESVLRSIARFVRPGWAYGATKDLSAYSRLSGSISTSTAVCGISFASQYAMAPLSSFVSTDRFGDFSRN
jgi:hypothetical protein